MKYEHLFSEGKIGNLTIKNRIVMESMLMGVGETDGTVGKDMLAYYKERAEGGVGLIMTEIVRVHEEHGASAPRQMSISSDEHIPALRRLAETVHKYDTKIMCQLHHPGRQNIAMLTNYWPISRKIGKRWKGYWKLFFGIAGRVDVKKSRGLRPVVGATDIPCSMNECIVINQPTRAMTTSEVKEMVQLFADGARRCKTAGIDGVYLHASHGYLFQQFLSPYTNNRTDEYGGKFENRFRFLKETIEAVKRECGNDYPIVVRLTIDEFYDRIGHPELGYHVEEGVKIAKELEKLGVAAIDASSGSYEVMNTVIEPTTYPLGWRKYLAKAVKDAVSIPVIAANVIRTPEQAEQQISEGTQDFIGLGRALNCDPYWPKKAFEGRSEDIQRCIGCLHCIDGMQNSAFRGESCECALNVRHCHERKYTKKPRQDGNGKTVAIVGAGPAGLTAARELAMRGFNVVILEKASKAGGQLLLAAAPPDREKMLWAVEDLQHSALSAGAKIQLNTKATKALLQKLSPYAVIIATGGNAKMPNIAGSDLSHVYTTTPILDGSVHFSGKKVVVIGGGLTGLETAELIASWGNKVTVTSRGEILAPNEWRQHVLDSVERLKKHDVRIMTTQTPIKINNRAVKFINSKSKEPMQLPADVVVVAGGVKPENKLYDELKGVFERTYIVGDALESGYIVDATHSAFKIARSL